MKTLSGLHLRTLFLQASQFLGCMLLAYEVSDYESDRWAECTVWWPDGRVREQQQYHNGAQVGEYGANSDWWWGVEDRMQAAPRRQRWGVTRDQVDW